MSSKRWQYWVPGGIMVPVRAYRSLSSKSSVLLANYEKDSCHLGDDKCWFKHEAKKLEVGEIVNEHHKIIY